MTPTQSEGGWPQDVAYQPDRRTQDWIERQVCNFPERWKKNLVNRWYSEVPGGRHFDATIGHHPEYFASTNLKVWADRLGGSRLPLDAKDSDICDAADQLAVRCADRAKIYHDMQSLRAAMNRIAEGQKIEQPQAWDEEKQSGVKDGPAVARMADPLWWRRKLLRVHAKRVEGAAIDLGYVNRARDCYVSNESVYRRAELMTRISGFERTAQEMSHAGLFFTMTCPSRMHKWATAKGADNRVIKNKRYDGTLPGEAQKYLAKVWSRIRARLARQGIQPYGFRIA
jgi:hypothetical protein